VTGAPRVVAISGAASGLGRALAWHYAAAGAALALADRDAPGLARLAAELTVARRPFTATTFDVTDRAAFAGFADTAWRALGPVELFFNNAGVALFAEARDLADADWQRLIDVNIRGVVHGVSAFYPRMLAAAEAAAAAPAAAAAATFGRAAAPRFQLVNSASISGLVPVAGLAGYAMTKHAVVGLSLALRAEAALYGVRVNALCPGFLATPLLERPCTVRLRPEAQARYLDACGGAIPLARAVPQIARAVAADRPIITLPGNGRLAWRLYRLWPSFVLRQSEKLARLTHALRIAP
jgi:NADP-dependent 3-hydroxy acid dehydrogenase YdfG